MILLMFWLISESFSQSQNLAQNSEALQTSKKTRVTTCKYLENSPSEKWTGQFHGPALIRIYNDQNSKKICVSLAECETKIPDLTLPPDRTLTMVACTSQGENCPNATDCFRSQEALLSKPKGVEP